MSRSSPTAGQIRKFLDLLEQHGVTRENFQKRLSSAALADLFNPAADLEDYEAWRLALKLGIVMPDVFTIPVDYGLSPAQMIELGHYDGPYGHEDRVSFEGKGKVEFEARYFHFAERKPNAEVFEAMVTADARNQWSPAGVEHLLSFGIKYPHEQRKFKVVALANPVPVRENEQLGSSISYFSLGMSGPKYDSGRQRVFCSEYYSETGFNLRFWEPNIRFLAVRKPRVA
ncbi:MAG TPA: hypothetical protein VHC20_02515 [Candidatus Paceibacterota bacterium]|nr:hypothetical protein [Candidatus Paceibacterota bacterium]